MADTVVTVAELAEELRCSREKVYRMARAGDIPGFRVGRVWRFDLDAVRARLNPVHDPWAQPARSRARRRAR